MKTTWTTTRSRARISALILAAPAALATTACSTRPVPDNNFVTLTLYASNTRIDVGDTTTLSAQSTNTAGREPKFDWKAEGAKLEQFQAGRIVHVTYPDSGLYTVTCTMTLKDGFSRAESREIKVDRVP